METALASALIRGKAKRRPTSSSDVIHLQLRHNRDGVVSET